MGSQGCFKAYLRDSYQLGIPVCRRDLAWCEDCPASDIEDCGRFCHDFRDEANALKVYERVMRERSDLHISCHEERRRMLQEEDEDLWNELPDGLGHIATTVCRNRVEHHETRAARAASRSSRRQHIDIALDEIQQVMGNVRLKQGRS